MATIDLRDREIDSLETLGRMVAPAGEWDVLLTVEQRDLVDELLGRGRCLASLPEGDDVRWVGQHVVSLSS